MVRARAEKLRINGGSHGARHPRARAGRSDPKDGERRYRHVYRPGLQPHWQPGACRRGHATGEITLRRGEVLPISGPKEKLLAAHRGGIEACADPKRTNVTSRRSRQRQTRS